MQADYRPTLSHWYQFISVLLHLKNPVGAVFHGSLKLKFLPMVWWARWGHTTWSRSVLLVSSAWDFNESHSQHIMYTVNLFATITDIKLLQISWNFRQQSWYFKQKISSYWEIVKNCLLQGKGVYNFRGKFNFKTLSMHTTRKRSSRKCPNFGQFKKTYKDVIFTRNKFVFCSLVMVSSYHFLGNIFALFDSLSCIGNMFVSCVYCLNVINTIF